MKSQYIEVYKQEALTEMKCGRRPYSVGTFLAYRLRGNAKSWAGRYYRSLVHGLEQEGWIPTKSKLNGKAYSPAIAQ